MDWTHVDSVAIRDLMTEAMLVLAEQAQTRVHRAAHAVEIWNAAPPQLKALAGEQARDDLMAELYRARRAAAVLVERPFVGLPLVLEIGTSSAGETVTRVSLHVGVA